MTTPTFGDHLLLAVLVAVSPLAALFEYRWLERAVARGRPDARTFAYQWVAGWEWILTAAVLTVWLGAERSIADLGLGIEWTPGFFVGVGLAFISVVALRFQVRWVSEREEFRKKIADQFLGVSAMLPRDDREERWFRVLSLTAGICEEILYRGFVMAYVAAFAGVSAAVVVSSVVFGLGHSYQGASGAIKAGALGVVFALVFVLTGSLWVPMLIHAAVDIANGTMARTIVDRARRVESPEEPAQP